MRVALIWPNGFKVQNTIPLAFGYLKSNIKNKDRHQIKIIDCSLENLNSRSVELREKILEFKPDVLGISFWSPNYYEALSILMLAKSIDPNMTTVVGGPHATSYSDKIMENGEIDFLFRGEADISFSVFLDELEEKVPDLSKVKGLTYRDSGGELVDNEQDSQENLDLIQLPDYEAINLDGYLSAGYQFAGARGGNAPIWITRGCPYRCGFCSAPFQNGRPVRVHSIDYMVRWVKYLYDKKNIRQLNIIDDNFTYHIKYAKEFCRRMIELDLPNLRFCTPNGIRQEKTDFELLTLMKKAGWDYVFIAPESGSVKTLQRMQKDLDPKTIPQKVKEIKSAGLKVYGFFIVGYPGETIEDLKETEELMLNGGFTYLSISRFQPLPGTPIYDELVASNEIEDGLLPLRYNSPHSVYTPEGLKNFNFSRFFFKNQLKLMLKSPSNIFYLIWSHDKRVLFDRFFFAFKNALSSRV